MYDKRISQEVVGEDLGEEFAGYVCIMLRIYEVYNNCFRSSESLVVTTSKVLP